MHMTDNMLSFLAIIPLLFWGAIAVLVIILLVKLINRKPEPANEMLFEKLAE